MEMPLFFFYFVLLFLLTFDVIVPGMSRMWHFSNKNVAKLKMHHDLSNCFDKFDLLESGSSRSFLHLEMDDKPAAKYLILD